ncbi:DUF3833 domain-containing protein [Variovorax sp. VNK109]|uniref:DUF3833 domain-containing protein n=1 Tax=Variovorax sp. VNK109 TaxID=3400919 RepID=UPI003C0DAADB
MMKRILVSLSVVLATLITGCAAPSVDTYAAEKPALKLDSFFNGELRAYGFFRDRSGKVVKRFTVDMRGEWSGNKGVLDERFLYSDGSTERRVWRLTLGPDGSVTGEAGDVVGEATGKISGNALQWRYVLSLPVNGKVYDVQMDDWMYLQTDKVMLNTAKMSKFGFTLGEVVLTFVKP